MMFSSILLHSSTYVLHTLIQVGGKTYYHFEDIHYPLILGKNFRDGHPEDLAVQRRVNLHNQPKKIFHVRGAKKKVIDMKSKVLGKLHLDLGHGSKNNYQRNAPGLRL